MRLALNNYFPRLRRPNAPVKKSEMSQVWRFLSGENGAQYRILVDKNGDTKNPHSAEPLEQLRLLGLFDFATLRGPTPDARPHLHLRETVSGKNHTFFIGPQTGLLSKVQLKTSLPQATRELYFRIAVNPRSGIVGLERHTPQGLCAQTHVVLTPFPFEFPSYFNQPGLTFARFGEHPQSMRWEKFSGHGLKERLQHWFLKRLARELPLKFLYEGKSPPEVKWSLNTWRQKEISLCVDALDGAITEISFSAMEGQNFDQVWVTVDSQRRWFDFRFDFLGYRWFTHFSFGKIYNERFAFPLKCLGSEAVVGEGFVLFSEKTVRIVMKKTDDQILRLDFDSAGNNTRYLFDDGEGKRTISLQPAPPLIKARFLPYLSALETILQSKGRSEVLNSLTGSLEA